MRTTEQLLDILETAKRNFDLPQAKIAATLSSLREAKIDNASDLIRLHETLLFMRAYPRGPRLVQLVEGMLKKSGRLVAQLVSADVDVSPVDDPEVSGIAGGSVTSNFSYAIVRWLVEKFPAQVSIDWDWFEEEDRFGAVMPRFMPLLEDDAMVEAHVPYREWVRAARGRQRNLTWLIGRFASLPLAEKEKANLYEGLKLHVIWRYGFRSSRTGGRQV